MCNCTCKCCKDQGPTQYSETSIRLAEELRDKAIRNLKRTPNGRRILARYLEERKLK
jgi:hypothetical protein